jgi:hypothetical protein
MNSSVVWGNYFRVYEEEYLDELFGISNAYLEVDDEEGFEEVAGERHNTNNCNHEHH